MYRDTTDHKNIQKKVSAMQENMGAVINHLRRTKENKKQSVQPIPADMRLLFSIGIPYFLLPNLDSVNHCTSKEISMEILIVPYWYNG